MSGLEPPAAKAANDTTREVTGLLQQWSQGDRAALDQLAPIIYGELVRLARARLRHDEGLYAPPSLDPTALVHECYLRLADQTRVVGWQSSAHFYAVAATVMRRVLIDHARKRRAQKRDAGARVTLTMDIAVARQRTADTLQVDDALRRLAAFDERKGRAIELKFFGGMTTDEIALVLGVSVGTVGRDLRLGQAWLRRELSRTTE